MKIQHTYERLLVEDFGAVFRFYRDVMGFTPTYGDENDGIYAEFDTGTPALALFRRDFMAAAVGAADKPASAAAQDRHALIFQVDDVDEAARDLKSRGVSFESEPSDQEAWGIRVAHFRDPDGNLLEINAALKK